MKLASALVDTRVTGLFVGEKKGIPIRSEGEMFVSAAKHTVLAKIRTVIVINIFISKPNVGVHGRRGSAVPCDAVLGLSVSSSSSFSFCSATSRAVISACEMRRRSNSCPASAIPTRKILR